jgi:hypothetical protein
VGAWVRVRVELSVGLRVMMRAIVGVRRRTGRRSGQTVIWMGLGVVARVRVRVMRRTGRRRNGQIVMLGVTMRV